MKAPKSLADLKFAAELAPGHEDDLETDGDYDRAQFADLTFADASAGGARFLECAFTGVTFDGGWLRRSRLSEVWFGQTRFVALDAAESSLTDVWLNGCVLAGMQAFGLLMRRVTFRGCKLDSVNFRESTLTDVTFEDCVLREADFSGAKLTRVRFPGCQLAGLAMSNVTCSTVDLRGATLGGEDASGEPAPGIRSGYESLSGVRVDSLQLMTLAPLLAHHLGIAVDLLLSPGGRPPVPPGCAPDGEKRRLIRRAVTGPAALPLRAVTGRSSPGRTPRRGRGSP